MPALSPCPFVRGAAVRRSLVDRLVFLQVRTGRCGLSLRPHAAGRPWAERVRAVRTAVKVRIAGSSVRTPRLPMPARAEARRPRCRSARPWGTRTAASSSPGSSSWPDGTVLRSPRGRESGRGDCGLLVVRRSGLRSLRSERAYGVRTLMGVRMRLTKSSPGLEPETFRFRVCSLNHSAMLT